MLGFKETYYGAIKTKRGQFERGLIDRSGQQIVEGHPSSRVSLIGDDITRSAREFLNTTAQEGAANAGLDQDGLFNGEDIRIRKYVWENGRDAYAAIVMAQTMKGIEEAKAESEWRSEASFSLRNLSSRINFAVGPLVPHFDSLGDHEVFDTEPVEKDSWKKIEESAKRDNPYADLFEVHKHEDGSNRLGIVELIPGLAPFFERFGPYPVKPIVEDVAVQAIDFQDIIKGEEVTFSWDEEKPDLNKESGIELNKGIFADVKSLLGDIDFGDL